MNALLLLLGTALIAVGFGVGAVYPQVRGVRGAPLHRGRRGERHGARERVRYRALGALVAGVGVVLFWMGLA
jgi:hypothetical protein